MNNKIFLGLFIFIAVISLGSAALTDQLTHYWDFDETSGTNAKDSGGIVVNNQLNMTLTGGAAFNPGHLGNGLFCDGTNDYAITDGSTDGTVGLPVGSGNWTLSAWVNSNEAATGTIYSSSTGLAERIFNGDFAHIRVFFGGADSGVVKPVLIQDNSTWQHVVIIKNSTTILTYVNNTLVNSTAGASTPIPAGNATLCADSGPGNYFDGRIDEFGIWNRSITSEEINLLYNAGAGLNALQTGVSLISPVDNFVTLNENLIFNASLSFNTDINLTNATLYIWYANSTLLNQTTNIVTGNVKNLTSWNITLPFESFNWNVLGCHINSTSGHNCEFAGQNFTLTYGFKTITEISTSPVIETQKSRFELNLTIPTISTISSAWFHYNNTRYSVVPSLISGFNYSLSESVVAPVVPTPTNINFHWEVLFASGFSQNTTTQQQTVNPHQNIEVGLSCSAGFDKALTFDFKDENLTSINSSAEYNINYGIDADNLNLIVFGNITNVNTFSVCVNSSLPEFITGKTQIKYGSGAYVEKDFFVYSGLTLTNETNNHTLYNLPSSLSTSFLVTVEDTSLTPYENKYVALLRWYPELNEYKVVSMGETDENGQIILKVITEDIDYRVGVYEKNGSLIKLAESTRFVCLVNPCTFVLKVSPIDEDFTSIFDVEYDLTYNATTSVWLLTYSDLSQRTTGMNLTIYKVTGTSVYPICSTFASSYTGVLTCDTSAYSGTFRAVVYRSASPAVPITQKVISTLTTAFSSSFGLWLSLIIGIPIASVFAFMSPVAAVIGGVIMLIPAFYLGAINLTILGGIAILGGITMHFLKRIG